MDAAAGTGYVQRAHVLFVDVVNVHRGLRKYLLRHAAVRAEHEAFIAGTDPDAIPVPALLDGVDLELAGFPFVSLGRTAAPRGDDFAAGGPVLPFREIDNAVSLGPHPHGAVSVGEDGPYRAGKVLGDGLGQDVPADGILPGIHHGALAVGADPDHALMQVMVQTEDSDVPVDGLRLVFAEGLQAEQAVHLKADEEVLVERDDARDIAIFLDEGRQVPDIDLRLPGGVVEIQVIVLVDETHHPGLVIDFAEGLGMEVLYLQLRFRIRGVGLPGREGIDLDVSIGPAEAHHLSLLAHKGEAAIGVFIGLIGDIRLHELFVRGVVVVQGIPAGEPGVPPRVGREIDVSREGIGPGDFPGQLGQPVQGLEGVDPKIVSVGLADGADDVVGESAVGPEVGPVRLHGRTVVAVEPVVRPHPNQIRIVLEDGQHGTVRQPFRAAHPFKHILRVIARCRKQRDCRQRHSQRQQAILYHVGVHHYYPAVSSCPAPTGHLQRSSLYKNSIFMPIMKGYRG